MNKENRKNENSVNRNSKNERRKESNFNSRNYETIKRDYENYYEFAEESRVNPLENGANEISNANQMSYNSLQYNQNNKKNRKKNRSLDD